jgi:selenocysteine lyase/cysteine desulfurase
MRAERRPDPFIRYEYPHLIDESRDAVAKILKAPVEGCVFVPNATTAVNVVLRALEWNEDGKDIILFFSTVYGGCGKTIDYVVDTSKGLVSSYCIELSYPEEDADITSKFKAAVRSVEKSGKRAKICIYDVVSSMPGVRFPFEAMTAACKDLGVMSLIDGAQGIGMVDINLGQVDPDFFTSNCHKWLHVPRGCAVFYCAARNQALIPSTVPTSHGYVPKAGSHFARINPLPPSSKSVFINNFEFFGTVDNSPSLCVKDSIKWRRQVLGGEELILNYIQSLAKEGGKRVADILGSTVLENSMGTLTNCAMVNIALPLAVGKEGDTTVSGVVAPKDVSAALNWMLETLMRDYKTFIALFILKGRFYARLSAQVYLDMSDFEWAGVTLKELVERIRKEFTPTAKAKL